MKRNENERRGWTIVALSLLIGLLCVFVAGDLAIRFAPTWRLDANMRSRLNPDVVYLTPPAESAFLPINPAILTPPIWINSFLTPGQTFPTRQPKPTSTAVSPVAPTQASPAVPATASPTPTIFYFPATQTSKPAATNTKTANSSTPAPKTQTSTATLPPSLIPTGTIFTPTSTTTATKTFTPTSTATPTFTATATATASPTPSNTPLPQADLAVTINDGVVLYSPGGSLTYTVVVSNFGPGNVTGAQVANAIPQQISGWSWVCTSQTNGASGCDPAGFNAGSFSDTVNLPSGASIVYTVNANTSAGATGDLINTVTITPPVTGPDPAPGNNSATDVDDQLNPLPYGNIGSTPDYQTNLVPLGSSVTLAFSKPLVVNGNPSWDVVIYEYPNGSGIAMDVMVFQIGDGTNWYTVFNWGNDVADTNSNLNINDPALGPTEVDNRDLSYIPASNIMYPFGSGTDANPATGIVLNVDGMVPNGTYPYFRIVSPSTGDLDGGCEIDAVATLP